MRSFLCSLGCCSSAIQLRTFCSCQESLLSFARTPCNAYVNESADCQTERKPQSTANIYTVSLPCECACAALGPQSVQTLQNILGICKVSLLCDCVSVFEDQQNEQTPANIAYTCKDSRLREGENHWLTSDFRGSPGKMWNFTFDEPKIYVQEMLIGISQVHHM